MAGTGEGPETVYRCPTGMASSDGGPPAGSVGFDRLYSSPGVVRAVAFAGRNATRIIELAVRFTPIVQRIAVIVNSGQPLPDSLKALAREWGVGVIELSGEVHRHVLTASRAEIGVPSVYRWWIAEVAYSSWLYENTQPLS
jgi:hypothetical protein